jgi:WD40 repeat protein
LFLNWEQGVTQFQYYSPRVEKRDFNDPGKASSLYTKTVFIPNSEMAVTGTNKGVILVWDRSLIVEGIGEQNEKRLMKVVNFSPEPITILTTAHDKYLVCGFGDGKIKFYDFQFKIMAWFDDLYFHRIKSISFSKKKPLPSSTKKNQLHYDEEEVKGKEKEEIFACSDFLVADESALICSLQSTLFEAIKASEKKG